MSGLNIKLVDLQISDFHALECCFLWWHTGKKPSASGGVAPTPLPGALPLDPTGGLLQPPDPCIIFLLFHFYPVPCLLNSLLLHSPVRDVYEWLHPKDQCVGSGFLFLLSRDGLVLISSSTFCLIVVCFKFAWYYFDFFFFLGGGGGQFWYYNSYSCHLWHRVAFPWLLLKGWKVCCACTRIYSAAVPEYTLIHVLVHMIMF